MIEKIEKIMKKRYFFILIIIIFMLLGFKQKDNLIYEASRIEDVQYITVGDSVRFGIDHLKKIHDFDHVEMIEESNELTGSIESSVYSLGISWKETNQFFYMNHRMEIIAKRQGVAKLSIMLYKDEEAIKRIELGLFAVLNDTHIDDTWVGLNSDNFNEEIDKNPDGKFYLESDLTDGSLSGVNYFSGTLLNPNQYVIKLSNIRYNEYNQGLFTVLDGAYIDGLIIRESNLMPTTLNRIETVSIGFLAAYAGNSLITNVSVEGDITNDIRGSADAVGGIVGVSYGSLYRHVSFVGNIEGNFENIGGLIGYTRFDYRYNFMNYFNSGKSYDMIDGAFVISNIVSSNSPNSSFTNAFMGRISSNIPRIRHGYFDGTIGTVEVFERFPFYFGATSSDYLQYLYSTLGPLNTENPNNLFSEDEYMEIDNERLKSSEPLPGLTMFIFEEDEYPKLSVWRLP